MAIPQIDHQQQNPSLFLDSLYCQEPKFEVEVEEQSTNPSLNPLFLLEQSTNPSPNPLFLLKQSTNPSLNALFLKQQSTNPSLDPLFLLEQSTNPSLNPLFLLEQSTNPSLNPLFLLENDLFYEDNEELLYLLSKENQTHCNYFEPGLFGARGEAVNWIVGVKAHFGFNTLTAVLAINYLDRFLFGFHFENEKKPWMTQLLAVTCLSLAAKVEETRVPLLLDLQVETEYVFEAKTIERMEILVLSTLEWRMNPVTPLSFVEHITRRLGLKTQSHWKFLCLCEDLLLSLVSDSRFVRYLPSVLATATIFHVIHQVEPCNPIQYQNQLLGVLRISKEEVNECYKLIVDLSNKCLYGQDKPHKRKYEQIEDSPSGVIDAQFISDGSNDSWVVESSVCSSPEHLLKKNRAEEKQRLSDVLISLSTH